MYMPVRPIHTLRAGNIHAVIVVKLHLTALIAASFKAIVDIGARSSRWDEKIHLADHRSPQ